DVFKQSSDSVTLNYAYNGYGILNSTSASSVQPKQLSELNSIWPRRWVMPHALRLSRRICAVSGASRATTPTQLSSVGTALRRLREERASPACLPPTTIWRRRLCSGERRRRASSASKRPRDYLEASEAGAPAFPSLPI